MLSDETTARAIGAYDFLVQRDNLHHARIEPVGIPALASRQALLRIERYALTANTISYAASAEQLGFWEFCPAPEGWGSVPTWGYAEVIDSRSHDLKVGERLFGYMPMSSHLVINPDHPTPNTISDGTPHRAHLPAVYNLYHRDPVRGEDQRSRRALLEPVFLMSFVMDDDMKEHGDYGAESILVISASSKTSLGLAYLLKARKAGEIVGLTAPENVDFVRSTGYYDRVISYDDVAELASLRSVSSADMSGNERLLEKVHQALGDKLTHSFLIGITHWAGRTLSALPGDGEAATEAPSLPGPKPVFAFGPDYVRDRVDAWGQEDFQERVDLASKAFVADSDRWMSVEYVDGSEASLAAYHALLRGTVVPSVGMVVRP